MPNICVVAKKDEALVYNNVSRIMHSNECERSSGSGRTFRQDSLAFDLQQVDHYIITFVATCTFIQ